MPDARFCVCCGETLAEAAPRQAYAAAPHERWWHPRLVSTIFPHLPRADLRPFRAGLATAVVLVVVLCLLRLFPLALVVSAIAVPLLFVLYLWDADVYEDEPLAVLAVTVLWGLAGGVVLGLARHVESQASLLSGTSQAHDLIWLGIVLPCVALLVMVAGPLALLPYRRFNDALDGVAFGAASAATLVAAEAITNSAGILQLGFKAAGNTGLWVARLLTLGVALPVLAAGVSAAVCAAFWLRYRCQIRDRNALGPLGRPLVAVPAAAAAVVAAYVTPLYLGIQRDTSARDLVLGPEIGFVPGISLLYKATADQPPSPSEQVEIAFMAATHEKETVVVEAVTNESPAHDASSPFPSYQAVDLLLDTFQWMPQT